MRFKVVLIVVLLSFGYASRSQDVFNLSPQSSKFTMKFKLVSNLIVLPIRFNGSDMNFILDTGVKQTILINIQTKDSLKLKNLKTVFFVGIGNTNTRIKGVSSNHNRIQIGEKLFNNDHTVYFIHNLEFDFSEKIGVIINGFIGGDLLKDFIVKINYRNRKITFYKRNKFKRRKLRRYKKYDIELIKGKPYIDASVQLDGTKEQKLKFLIDTGSSDAVWLFENERIKMPGQAKYIVDYLGRGLSGNVDGRRTKMTKFILDNHFNFKNIYVAFPDLTYTEVVNTRNFYDGILGNEIMRRFFVFLDYHNQKLYLKKYRGNYDDDFYYNISGISVAYGGKILVQEETAVISHNTQEKDNRILIDYKYEYKLKPIYLITYVRKDSPADKAGLLRNDMLLEVNGRPSYKYRLQELRQYFFGRNKKTLRLLINRRGRQMKFDIKNVDVFQNME